MVSWASSVRSVGCVAEAGVPGCSEPAFIWRELKVFGLRHIEDGVQKYTTVPTQQEGMGSKLDKAGLKEPRK